MSRALFLYDYWFVRGFSPRYKGLERLQNGAKKEVTLSAHKGTHILRRGDRRNGNYCCSLPTYSVPSAKSAVSGNPFKKYLLHHELGPEDGAENKSYSRGEAIKNNCNDNIGAIRERSLLILTPTQIATLNGKYDYPHFIDMEIWFKDEKPARWFGGRSKTRVLTATAA